MVDDLYQETILDHSKRPRNFHPMDDANRKAEGYNPLCGDKLKLFLRVEDDIVKEASFLGAGCAISTASASLMTESLKGGKPVKVGGKTVRSRVAPGGFQTILNEQSVGPERYFDAAGMPGRVFGLQP